MESEISEQTAVPPAVKTDHGDELDLPATPVHLDPGSNFVGDSLEQIVPNLPPFRGCEVCEKYDEAEAEEKKTSHIRAFHCGLAVARKLKNGKQVFCFPCRRGCMKRVGKNVRRSHYHCPVCGKMCGRRANMTNHLRMCRGGTSISQYMATIDKETPHKNASTTEPGAYSASNHVLAITEKRLNTWIQSQRQLGKPIDIETLRGKAKFLYEKTKKDLGMKNARPFFGGRDWIRDFMKRNGLKDVTVIALGQGPASTTPQTPSKDIIKLIIEQVERNPCLYDPLLAALEEQNSERESTLWEEIAKNVGLDSGKVANKIWKNLEKRYINRNKPGVMVKEYWEYEKYLQFLSSVVFESVLTPEQDDSFQQSVTAIQDVEFDDNNMVTVTVLNGGESSENVEDGVDIEDDSLAYGRRIKVAQLKRINLEMEIMKEEHQAKMEILQMEKEVLMKKLDKL